MNDQNQSRAERERANWKAAGWDGGEANARNQQTRATRIVNGLYRAINRAWDAIDRLKGKRAMSEEEARRIVAEMADKADNLLGAMKLPGLRPEIHLMGLRSGLEEISAELKRAYIVLSGENPWP